MLKRFEVVVTDTAAAKEFRFPALDRDAAFNFGKVVRSYYPYVMVEVASDGIREMVRK